MAKRELYKAEREFFERQLKNMQIEKDAVTRNFISTIQMLDGNIERIKELIVEGVEEDD